MKKVLVGTCVLAMTAFGVTNASADPASSVRASAFGISIDLLGSELIDQEPEVTSELPPGGSEEEDVLTIDGEELALEGVGIQQAETRAESTLSPMLVSDGEDGEDGGGLGISQLGGGEDDEEGGSDLLGLDLGEITDILGGGDDEGDDGGSGVPEGFGGPDDDDIEIPQVNARALSSISITGVLLDDEGGGGSGGSGDGIGNIFEDILGGDDPLGEITGQSAEGAGAVQTQQTGGEGDDVLGGLVDDLLGGSAGDELTEIVFEALLRLGVIESEAVAVCTNNESRFDVASRLADGDGSDIDLGDLVDDILSEVVGGSGTEDEALLESLLGDLIDTEEGEVGLTDDGGVFINALHITIADDLGLGGSDGGGGDDLTGIVDDVTGGGDDGGGSGGDEGDEPLLDIILGHSEVSGVVCAQQAPPPPAPPLPPSGDPGTLPVTGGGIGALPAVLALGLAGGAVAAGRLALRSRREDSL